MESSLELRPMTRDDLPELASLAEGRNVLMRDYERHLALEGGHGFVLRDDRRLLGAVTVMRHYEHGFLGPPLLREDADGGVGLRLALMHEAVSRLQLSGVTSLDVEATEAEAPLLRGLGFEAVRRTLVLERAPAAPRPARLTVAMEDADLLDVGALDAAAVGYGRKGYLAALRDDLPEAARVLHRGDDVGGFALVRRARRGHHLGPLVTRAGDVDAAATLLADAVAEVADEPLVALAPEETPLLADLRGQGFTDVGALLRMRAGSREAPEGSATEWLLGSRLTG